MIGKNREYRYCPSVYLRERYLFHRTLVEKKLKFDYFKLFFPNKCETINDVLLMCDSHVTWDDAVFMKRLEDCFSETIEGELHYKVRGVIGNKKARKPQYRVYHSTNALPSRFYYVNNEKGVRVCKELKKTVEFMRTCGNFHLYERTVCIPYFRDAQIAGSLLNLYELPDLMFYEALTKHNIQESTIWKHLTEVICWENPYKINWLFTYIAMKIQQPERKVEKILTLVADTTGCGKSSFFFFMLALLGINRTFEFTQIEQLSQKFNAHLQGKLLILVDDIEKLTKKQQQNLKTTCTQKHFKLEKKGVDSTLDCAYYDPILTSNNDTNIWIETEDRRSEIIRVNPKYRQTKENKWFWDSFYKELSDKCLMKAFFEYFAKYPIELDIRNKEIRFDKKVLEQHVSNSLLCAHEFLRVMFEEPDWIQQDGVDLTVYRTGHVWIGTRYLYRVFSNWAKGNGQSNVPRQKTFASNLESIGLRVKRVREIDTGRQVRRVELSPKTIRTALASKYGEVEVLQTGLFETIEGWKENKCEWVHGCIYREAEVRKMFPDSGFVPIVDVL